MDETRHAETPAGLDATAPLETVPFDDAPTVPIALTQPVPLKRPKRRSGRRRRPLPRIPLHRAHFVLFGAVVAAVAGATAVAQTVGDDQRHGRPRHNHQHHASEEKGEIDR